MSATLELVHALEQATWAQLEAARILDGAGLDLANARRADLLFELEIELQERPRLVASEREALRAALERLQRLEERVVTVSASVVQVLDAAVPRTTGTYTRGGRIAG